MNADLIIFEDKPSTKTPWNAENVNHNFEVLNKKISNVIEAGGSENSGWYVKFDNGVMIAGKRTSLGGSSSSPTVKFSASGNLFQSDVINIGNFPQAFKEVWYNVTTYLSGQGNYAWQMGYPSGYDTTKFNGTMLLSRSEASMWSLFFYSLAIGKWK